MEGSIGHTGRAGGDMGGWGERAHKRCVSEWMSGWSLSRILMCGETV